jgi:hypothetical protein
MNTDYRGSFPIIALDIDSLLPIDSPFGLPSISLASQRLD